MTLEEAEKLDNILLRFQNIEGVGTSQLKNEDVRKRYKLLQAKGYITLMEMSGENRIASVSITPSGIAFINEGGFVKVIQNENKDDLIRKLQKENLILSNNKLKYERTIRIWKAIALGLSIASYLIGYFKPFLK